MRIFEPVQHAGGGEARPRFVGVLEAGKFGIEHDFPIKQPALLRLCERDEIMCVFRGEMDLGQPAPL